MSSANNRYESHITVAAKDLAALSVLQGFCLSKGLKCLVIELAQGEHPCQPMTSGFHQGSEEQVKAEVFALASELATQGLTVERVKIEAHIQNSDLPLEDPTDGDDKKYYEAHFRVMVPSEDRLRELQGVCRQHGVHVSRNAQANKPIRFVTLRVYRAGLLTAQQRAADIVRLLQESGFEITKQIQEYVVFDSRLELDRGW
jgi:hypothetical protein